MIPKTGQPCPIDLTYGKVIVGVGCFVFLLKIEVMRSFIVRYAQDSGRMGKMAAAAAWWHNFGRNGRMSLLVSF